MLSGENEIGEGSPERKEGGGAARAGRQHRCAPFGAMRQCRSQLLLEDSTGVPYPKLGDSLGVLHPELGDSSGVLTMSFLWSSFSCSCFLCS